MEQRQLLIKHQCFTKNFIKHLKQHRQDVIKTLDQTDKTSLFIMNLFKDQKQAWEYGHAMESNRSINTLFRGLRTKINQDTSPTDYKKIINTFENQLNQKFKFQISLASNNLGSSNLMDKNNTHFIQGNDKPVIEGNNYVRPRDHQNEEQFDQNSLPHKKPKTQLTQIQRYYYKAHGSQSQVKKTPPLQVQKLIIQVRYLQNSIDYENYQCNGYKLKIWLDKYIRKYLSQNSIDVNTQLHQIKIMEQIDFIKSKQAGNYLFNPFFDVLQIWIKLKNNQKFKSSFHVSGDIKNLSIVSKSIPPAEWNKNLMKLHPKSTIKQLVDYLGRKRQASENDIHNLFYFLSKLGGANYVQDLFGFERSDFSNLKVKPTYIFEIQEIIEQIRDCFNIKSQKILDQRRKQCIKIGTSHKILRYVAYKVGGQKEVKNIAWLNIKNMEKAFQIVKQQFQNQEIFIKLENYFVQFALDPDGIPLSASRGSILYGPPGTGKTYLTEALPRLIGFHLIQKGLSATDFMKTYVGQASRMLKGLGIRATISQWLLCSIAIDEVDGLVPSRKDKDQKNKHEGISILLSLIGGNKDVPNLVYLTSTNYIKKIDEAIGRRLDGKFLVGRPNPNQRQKIIISKVDYLKNNKQFLAYIVKITTNFTGAALQRLSNELLKSLKLKRMNNKPEQLIIQEITNFAIVAARQHGMNFGMSTLPQIYHDQLDKKFIFTETFLKRISKHFLLVKHQSGNQFMIAYANEIQKFYRGELKPVYEQEENRIEIKVQEGKDPFESFSKYVQAIFQGEQYLFQCINSSQYQNYKSYAKKVNQLLDTRQRMANQKTVFIIQDHHDYPVNIRFSAKLFERNSQNLYIIYYTLPGYLLEAYTHVLFPRIQENGINQNSQYQLNYSGRIMVELNEETRMAFELKNCMEIQSKIAFKNFLKSEENNSLSNVTPELVQFFTKQQVSYLLLIDYQLLLQNQAFQEKKILEVLEEKMFEAKDYKKVAVIIDVDSLILLNQNASDSNFGRNMSYSIQNHNLFQILLNYMRNFPSTAKGNSKWMTMIVKNPELIKILKRQISWPKYPQQIQKQDEQKELDKEKRCIRCNAFYTQRKNRQERKCMQHPGKIINTRLKCFQDKKASKLLMQKFRKQEANGMSSQRTGTSSQRNKNEQNMYVYACCIKGLNQPGDYAYYHITQEQFQTIEDQLYCDSQGNYEKWEKVLKYLQPY